MAGEFSPEDQALLDKIRGRQAIDGAALRVNTQQADPINGDTFAAQRRVAQRLGLPVEAVVHTWDDARLEDKANSAAQVAGKSPALQQRMLDPDFARLVHDDTDALGMFVDGAKYLFSHPDAKNTLMGDVGAGAYRASRGAAGVAQGAFEFAAPPLDWLDNTSMPGGNPLRRVAEGFAMQGASAEAKAKALSPAVPGVVAGGISSGVQSLTQNLLTLPMAFLGPGGASAALTGMVSMTGGQAYQGAREQGLPMGQAVPFAVSQAAIEYATEKIPLAVLLKNVKGGASFVKTLAVDAGLEIPGEQIATVLQDLNEWAVLPENKDKPFKAYLEERPGAAAQTLIATIIGAGGNVAVGKALEHTLGAASIDAENSRRATEGAQTMGELLKLQAAMKLHERAPDVSAGLLQALADETEGAPKEVRFDARQLADALQQAGADASLFPSVAAQLPEALATGGEVTVPLGEFSRIAGTELEPVLLQHARIGDNELSQAEAKQASEQAAADVKARADEMLAQAAQGEEQKASADAVKAKVFAELQKAGRFTKDVNEAYASLHAAFFATMAQRAGTTAEELFNRYALNVQATQPGGEALQAGGSLPGALAVEGYHFSSQDRPVLSTAFYGTGLKGSAREDILNHPDQRLRRRLSFYVDKGTGVRPESGVGGRAHRVQLTGIYDANADPLKLRGGDARAFESALLDRGYAGYLDRLEGTQPGQVVVLGDRNFTPELLGPVSRIEAGQRVEPLQATEPQWQTQATGTPEQLNARLARMKDNPAWAKFELRIEGDQLQYRPATLAQSRVKDMTPEIRKLLKNLTPTEQRKITDATAAKVIAQLQSLPPAKEMAAVALGGQAKRGWYQESARAISEVFGPDAARFAALLAATSPQCSVEVNLLNALNIWKNWTAAGRPTGREAIIDVMGQSVQGGRGRASVLDAWINNSVRALSAENPADAATSRVFLSGPKVNSFFLNLIGVTDEVTNDAWMANYALVDQVMFSGSMNVLGTDPGKGTGYLAMAARTREAAAYLTKVTGETWTPAEVQETVWSWAKTLYELQVGDMTATRALNEGVLTDELINSTPDFSSLFNDPTYGAILKEAGYAEQLDTLGSDERPDAGVADQEPAAGAEAAAFAPEAQARLRLQAARRLERLRAQRNAGRLEQGGLSGNREPGYAGGSLAPLPGAPAIAGASGPDPRIVAVAEQYAAEAGIPLTRQGAYVQVDPERARRIAQAYEAMPDEPTNPRVREAYDNLIQQTLAQYLALERAGYRFYLVDETNDPYQGNPWNAMRDLRANQVMGVFSTEAGFGTSAALNIGLADPAGGPNLTPERVLQAIEAVGGQVEEHATHTSDTEPTVVAKLKVPLTKAQADQLSADLGQEAIAQRLADGTGALFGPQAANWGDFNPEFFLLLDGRRASEATSPLLADTGLEWGFGSPDGPKRKVLANDLFRAVHDAFGHGLEGAGFRAQGEENAWQAHVRLFTGSAVGAITSETRGQNSWLNYGPYGESNQTAKVEDTHFADQKTGLMPEWTWTEGRAPDAGVLEQSAFHGTPHRGITQFSTDKIGTGEGHQAYGWGLYFASRKEIAEHYREALSDHVLMLDGENLEDAYDSLRERHGPAAGALLEFAVNDGLYNALVFAEAAVRAAPSKRQHYLDGFGDDAVRSATPNEMAHALAVLKDVKKESSGQLYEVDIPEDSEMLLWDKPLSAQPEKVREALREMADDLADLPIEYKKKALGRDEKTGEQLYRALSGLGNDKFASVYLASWGIKGIKYLDGGSRRAGDGTYNYVVFSGDDVAIKNQFYQGKQEAKKEPLATFSPSTNTISLLNGANLSSFLHESAHFFLEVITDMAVQPNAPADIVADVNTLMAWFKTDLAAWSTASLADRRKAHEKFAESFEQYLLEGKAPTPELQPMFRRFRAWMVNVYRSLKDFIAGRAATPGGEGGPAENPLELSDEVRAVFDRMLAAEDQIKQAEQLRHLTPLFREQPKGMSPAAWAAYQEQQADASDDAVEALQARSLRDMRWLSNAQSRKLKELQAQAKEARKSVLAEVSAEVDQRPIYQALRWLRKGEMVTAEGEEVKAEKGFRLSTAALDEMYPANALGNPDLEKLKGLTAANGLHPDIVAGMFGFSSGDELVRKLVDVEPRTSVIEGMTDQRMLERYGDLATEAGMKRAVDEALHEESRGRALVTELKALRDGVADPRLQDAVDKAVRITDKARTAASMKAQRSASTRVLVKAAKEFGRQLADRRKVRELKPGLYAKAETRAAKLAEQALAKGDVTAAAQAKQDQVLQHYAGRAATEALDDVRRGREYLKRFDKPTKGIDQDYRDQIDKLLERVDLRQQSNAALDKRAKLSAWISAQEELGIEPSIPDYLLEDSKLTSYRDMTVEQFRGLVDAIKQIEHLGRLKNKLLLAKDKREFAAIVQSLVDSVAANAGDRKAVTRTPADTLGKAMKGLRNFGAAHIKVASWARIMDGGKDGGPMWEHFVRVANEQGDWETERIAKATVELTAIMEPVLKAAKLGGKGTFFPAVNTSLNKEQVLAIALNTGNESNLQRLLGGEGWTLDQVQPVLATLTPADWKAVQAIWDYFESFRPEIGAKEKRIFGKEPEWIDAGSAVTDALGLRGGYYPVKYDPAASVRAEEHANAEEAKALLKGAYNAATTKRSFTKARAEEVVGRPLLYSLAGVYTGVQDVIHDLAWHEWLIDTNRLLRSQMLDSVIRSSYGPEVINQFHTWRDDIARGNQGAANALEMTLGRLRQSVSVAGLGFNVVSALMQPLGITQSIVRVGAGWIGRGIMQAVANPLAAARKTNDMSSFMRSRARTRFRELNELRNRVQGQSAVKRAINENAYRLMMAFQQLVDVPTWLGAYEKAVAEGNDDKRAVALADQAVIDSQGGGQTKDLSAIERGGPALKLFTTFYSFMNTAANLGAQSAMTPRSRAKLAADMLLLFTVPAVLGALLKDAITPGDSGDDDWEKLVRKLAAEQLSFLLGLFVVGREFGQVAQTVTGAGSRDYAGPPGLRAIADSYKFAAQAAQGEFDDSFRKASINLAGDIFGLPSAQLNRSITGTKALIEGETSNPAAALMGYQRP